MKIVYLYFVILIVGSCSKDTNNLGSDFEKLVGTWRNIEGDLPIQILIRKNGKIEVLKSIERGYKFRANYYICDTTGNSSGLNTYLLSENANGIEGRKMVFLAKPNLDTIQIETGTLIVNNIAQYVSVMNFTKE